MTRSRLVLLIACFLIWRQGRAQSIVTQNVGLTPTTLPAFCNLGDLRVDSSTYQLWLCGLSNTWGAIGSGGTAAYAGTAGYATVSGTASFATLSSFAGTASITTAFAATPTPCSAGQYASGISTVGNLTCAAVSFSQLTSLALVTQGGTGLTTATVNGLLYGNGTSAFASIQVGSAGQVLTGVTGAIPSFTSFPILGASAQRGGSLGLAGITSGTVSITVVTAAGTYNFVLPTTVGTAGQVLASGGGGTAPMTWANTSGLVNPMTTSQDIIVGTTSGTPVRLPVGTNSQVLGVNSGLVAWQNPMNLNSAVIASGTTWTAPATIISGTTIFKITITGAGGGGGGAQGLFSAGGGGGGGGTCIVFTALTASQVYTVAIGVGGSGGSTAATNGTAGTTTTFNNGSIIWGGVGGGGGKGSTAAGVGLTGGGGNGTTSNCPNSGVSIFGGGGLPALIFASGNTNGGAGGGSYFAGQGLYFSTSSGGSNGASPGQGASGANSGGATLGELGGTGANGLILLEWVQ